MKGRKMLKIGSEMKDQNRLRFIAKKKTLNELFPSLNDLRLRGATENS